MAESNKPQQPLAARLALVGGIALGLVGSFVIGPQLFPREPGQGFSVPQMLCAGATGALGAVLGWVIGWLIERPSRKD
jgi:hypothetical protein